MKINFTITIILLLSIAACQNQIDSEQLTEELFQTDIDFSDLSKEQGKNAAFTAYCANDAVMLAPNYMPIEGKKNIVSKLYLQSDTTYVLTWHPVNAFVAESGEMGYTYGIWNIETSDSLGIKINEQGTYVTVWKKNEMGEWKFVLDSGNEGLTPK